MRASSPALSESSGDSPRRAASRAASQRPSAIDDAMRTPYQRIETDRPPPNGRLSGRRNARAIGPGDRNTAPYYPTAIRGVNEKPAFTQKALKKSQNNFDTLLTRWV